MNVIRPVLVGLVALGGLYAMPAFATESYDNCNGFIDTLPATISTQGTRCLRKDLSTAMKSLAHRRPLYVNGTSIRPVCNNRVRNFTVSAYSTCIDGGGNFSN
ncbi:MAG TPA: hypothetical protein VGD21_04900 [Lysobacter sp.]